MMTTFDINSILFRILSKSSLNGNITGGFYLGNDRPVDSNLEDIVINSISMTQDYHPQIATSNVNIYVPDKQIKIKGKEQQVSDSRRLSELSKEAINILKQAQVYGLTITTDSQMTLDEPSINQHFVNIRVKWNIQTD